MGIIGWADASITVNEMEASEETPAVMKDSERTMVTDDDADAWGHTENDNRFTSAPMKAVSVQAEPIKVETSPPLLNPPMGNELFDAIRSLRLKRGDDECDISKFELHEVKFLFNHAERGGFSDYYGVVREVFAVKHRVLDEVDDIDEVESSNLDELLSFVEEKYEQSFEGGDA